MTAGIVASGALHLGLVAYLYQQRFDRAEPEPPPIRLDVRPLEIPKPPPPPPPPPPTKTSPVVEPPKASRIVARETPRVFEDLLPPTPPPNFDTGPSTDREAPPTTGLVGQADPGPTVVNDPPTKAVEPPPAPGPKVITRPRWIQRPTADQVARFYPQRALEREQEGMAMLQCTVTAAGRIAGCSVVGQTPPGAQFGKAALQLAQYFQMSPQMQDGQPVEGGSVRVPVRFRLGD